MLRPYVLAIAPRFLLIGMVGGAISGLISGCVSAIPVNTPPRSKFFDYSTVKPENHELLAMKYAQTVLTNTFMNPSAVRLDTSETGSMLKLGICQGDQLYNRSRCKLWATTVSVDATNAYGDYTGKKPYTLFFKDGEVIASQQADAHTFDQEPIAGGFYFPCNDVR